VLPLLDHEVSLEFFQIALSEDPHILVVDVREIWELQLSRLDYPSVTNIPVGKLMAQNLAELESLFSRDEKFAYILCHHGIRSERIARWLWSLGFKNSLSVNGGIDLYARKIDPTVGFY